MVEEKESLLALATALAGVRDPELSFAQVFDGLNDIEQLLFRHKDAYGVCNVFFQQGCEEFVLLCNTAAIQQLSRAIEGSSNLQKCGELIMRAEQHTRRSGYLRSICDEFATGRLQLRILSLNNLACFNKHIGKSLAAIEALEEILELQLKGESSPTEERRECAIAHTHLNLSAVLSQLGRHRAAAEHARSSINLLCQAHHEGFSIDPNLLVVAHYNLAVELEHLREVNEAASVITRSLELARDHGLHRDSSEIVRLLEDMRRSVKDTVSAYHSPVRARRPLSPRSLRQRG